MLNNGIWVGHADVDKAPFRVTEKGEIIAMPATITGKLEEEATPDEG